MQKIKSLAAVFLALFILAAIPTQALAAEAHVDAITAHTHQWYFDHYDTTYIPIDDEIIIEGDTQEPTERDIIKSLYDHAWNLKA